MIFSFGSIYGIIIRDNTVGEVKIKMKLLSNENNCVFICGKNIYRDNTLLEWNEIKKNLQIVYFSFCLISFGDNTLVKRKSRRINKYQHVVCYELWLYVVKSENPEFGLISFGDNIRVRRKSRT